MNVSRTPFRCVLLLLFLAGVFSARGQSFRKTYAPQSSDCRDLVETADGGFLMTGGITSGKLLFLQRTDANGTILWTKHQSLNGARGVAVSRMADGGFAVLGENYLDGGIARSMVLKIDAAGNTQWLKVIENPSLPNGFTDLISTSDGGLALVGDGRVLTPQADFYIRLLKLDASGILQWEQSIGHSNNTTELGRRLAEMPNGDLVLAGEIRGSTPAVTDGADFMIARTNAQGVIIWQSVYNKTGYQRFHDFLVSPDGSLVIMGESLQTDPVRIILLKTAGNGAELWYRSSVALVTDAGGSYFAIECMVNDQAGNLYIPLHFNGGITDLGLFLLKLSSAGDSLWTHAANTSDRLYTGIYTSNDKFAFAGSSSQLSSESAVLISTDWTSDILSFSNTLKGTVYWDKNDNCQPDAGDPPAPLIFIEARNTAGQYWTRLVSPDGHYSIPVDPGSYTLTVKTLPNAFGLWGMCDTPVVSVAGPNQTIAVPPIGARALIECPYLDVDLSAGALRRCTTANYYVSYCNHGNLDATGASVQITLDPLQSFVGSSIPLTAQSGNNYTFDIADVPPGGCGSFWVKLYLSCDATQGQSICTGAHIFPDSICTVSDSLWDGSNVELTAGCSGGLNFTVTNTGADMLGTCDYVIIEDQIMYRMGKLQLGAGADTVITVLNPTAGSSYYLRVNQRPGHPGAGQPAAVADNCNGPTVASLTLQLALNTDDPFVDIHCDAVVGSFDPNDKRGFPLGWRNQHYIEPNQELQYTIRFQNTGNDTAFLVIIRDQLPPELDPASVRPGAASHPYRFEMVGNDRLSFTFSNILLPDSTTNEPESHGFVNFTVSQKRDLTPGTVIENEAAIYFDFNEPVITNTSFHTIGRPLLSFTIDQPVSNALDLSIAPNPSTEQAIFRLNGLEPHSRLQLRLYNALGQPLRTERFNGTEYRFERQGLAAGLYYFRVEAQDGRFASGKLMLR